MPHKKIIHIRSVRYEVTILCNIGFFGSFTQDMPIARCYTRTIPHEYARATEKLLKEKIKQYLGAFNVQFKVGKFRLHFDCKIEEFSGRSHRARRKATDANAVIDAVVEDAIHKIHKKLIPFFISAQKDIAGIEMKMEQIVKNNSPIVIDNRL